MMIKKSKNLKYDKWIKLTDSFDEYNLFEPRICILESFNRIDNNLELNFKNKSRTVIRVKNLEGSRELDTVLAKLDEFMGKSYEEIINNDF